MAAQAEGVLQEEDSKVVVVIVNIEIRMDLFKQSGVEKYRGTFSSQC